ncbi:DUF1641 domain-containing protein [Salinirubellus salinus]|uniref:DUF1641 domain-containing protein n=1 Tax=Salinirubellus salinus TaxID=1364945 RepID=A0A9E7R1M5_9EURY|nr:DUF1641 domain-containing protein [Salinirubellus salinus]UWM53982.1 DUF1641 domain-containing protein [Salinirubellus salinus]
MSTLDEDDAERELPSVVTEAVREDPETAAALLARSGQLSTLVDEAVVEDLPSGDVPDTHRAELDAAVGQHGTELAAAVERVAMLQRTGTLDRLTEIADAMALLTDAMDDEMVETLAATGTSLGELADTASDDEVRRGLARVLEGVGTASAEEATPVGPLGLVGALRDPEVQAGMGYLVATARGIGTAGERPDGGRTD